MINAALSLIEKGKYDRLVYVRNNIEVKDTVALGSLPGDVNDKLSGFLMPLADHLGGIDGLNEYIEKGMVEVQHLGFIRGRDYKRSIIYCTEAENLTKAHAQLLIGRVGEGSTLWLNGDTKQTDKKVFEENSGMRAMIERLSGHPLFGYVYLPTSHRSETARLADLLD